MSQTPPVHAIAIATAFFLLVLAILFARAVRGTGPSRARRVLLPAIFFVLATFLVFGLPLVFLGLPLAGPAALAGALLWLALPALLSALIAEGIVFALNVERTPHWLTAGIATAVLANYGWLAALTGDLFFRVELVAIVPAMVAASAAIIWWPYLPVPEGAEEDDEDAAEVFQ
jgi:hypothetical protein